MCVFPLQYVHRFIAKKICIADFDLEDDMDPITFVDLSTPHATPRQPGAHSGGGGGGNRGATLNQRSPSNGHSPVRQLGGVGHTNNATFDRRNSGSSSNSTPPPLGQINQVLSLGFDSLTLGKGGQGGTAPGLQYLKLLKQVSFLQTQY